MRDVSLPFVLTRLVLLLITVSAPRWRWTVPDPARFLSPTLTQAPVGGSVLRRWYNWDTAWYMRLAGNGPQMGYSRYTEDPVHHFGTFAFFPLYPLLVHAVAIAVPGATATVPRGGQPPKRLFEVGLVVANLVFLLALVALYLLAEARAGPGVARRAVWLLCLFPTTIFFSAAYSESLFLLWLVLFFLLLERRRWWLAALCGALAAATRSLGVALMAPYLVYYWQQRRLKMSRSLLPLLLIPLGLLGYMAYLKLAWGDPLLFRKAEEAWSRSFAAPWAGIVDGISWSLRPWLHGHAFPGGLPQQNWRGLTDALYAAVFLLLTALAWRDLDWPQRAYAAIFWLYVLCEPNISNPLYPDTLISMARFLLMLLPLWLWLAGSRRRTLLMAVPSALLLLFYTARWVNGAWIG